MLFGSPSGVGEERDDIVEDTARAVTGAEIDVDVEAEAAAEDGATALEKKLLPWRTPFTFVTGLGVFHCNGFWLARFIATCIRGGSGSGSGEDLPNVISSRAGTIRPLDALDADIGLLLSLCC